MHRKILPATAAAVLVSAAALAHHGWSTYDASRTLVFDGPILSVKYENPHGEMQMEHEGGRWTVTLAPPSRLRSRGVSAEDLTVGRTVKVEGYPSRVNEREMRAERITLEGRIVELRR
jgi:Family of unknown function (DUF6152)